MSAQENATPPPSDGQQQPNGREYTEYPEQHHAGAVGLGPEYGRGASGGDVITGFKEELIGKITHNKEKYQHGYDLRKGEVKKKEQEADQEENPFKKAEEPPKKTKKTEHPSKIPNTRSGPSIESNSRPDSKAAKEQAATTAPEGTEDADNIQRSGEQTRRDN